MQNYSTKCPYDTECLFRNNEICSIINYDKIKFTKFAYIPEYCKVREIKKDKIVYNCTDLKLFEYEAITNDLIKLKDFVKKNKLFNISKANIDYILENKNFYGFDYAQIHNSIVLIKRNGEERVYNCKSYIFDSIEQVNSTFKNKFVYLYSCELVNNIKKDSFTIISTDNEEVILEPTDSVLTEFDIVEVKNLKIGDKVDTRLGTKEVKNIIYNKGENKIALKIRYFIEE